MRNSQKAIVEPIPDSEFCGSTSAETIRASGAGARLLSFLGAGLLIVASLGMTVFVAPAAETNFAKRYKLIFHEARTALEKNPTNAAFAWQFARACFDWAEFSTNDSQRAEIAQSGIAAARSATHLEPTNAAAHYYLAMNLGQLARTKSLGALRLVGQMEGEFRKARSLDEQFDYGGADRCLGLLYRDAPGWPVSVGNRRKAAQHLARASELSYDYPDNHLNLLEAWWNWGESKRVAAEIESVGRVLGEARKKLTGEMWAWAWADWDRRWKDIQTKVSTMRPDLPRRSLR
ncbi:MAG: hypothetical protein HZA90_00095 [Verrucomicrobia bacterium]|nr:hypothetical protein [Verrucomicrobiota bacterium]